MKSTYLLAASVALMACADVSNPDGSTPQPEQKTLRLELEPGHVVEYAIGSRGEVLIEETGEQGVHEVAGRVTSLARPSAVFARYHPGVEVPAEVAVFQKLLTAAQVDELPDDEGGPGEADLEMTEDAADAVLKHATSDAAHFRDAHFGCFFGPNDVYTACLTNRTGGGSSSASARWAIYKTAPYRGNITVRRTYGSSSAVRVIEQGTFNWAWARGALTRDCGFNCSALIPYPQIVAHRVEVYDAEGDGYHRSARFHNLKYDTAECAEVSTTNPRADTFAVWCQARY